ncbi:MAG TPA: NADH-quinone oxidoreductase subunit NuoK [Bacillota bacterium]|nr:NADH-quinone oxidoreductase subunit NuoK [Bacillota bacterium]
MPVGLPLYIGLSAVLFVLGGLGLLLRRDPLVMVMAIELMWNAANLALIATARHYGDLGGQVFAFVVITVAAADVAIGLALTVLLGRTRGTLDADRLKWLKG